MRRRPPLECTNLRVLSMHEQRTFLVLSRSLLVKYIRCSGRSEQLCLSETGSARHHHRGVGGLLRETDRNVLFNPCVSPSEHREKQGRGGRRKSLGVEARLLTPEYETHLGRA